MDRLRALAAQRRGEWGIARAVIVAIEGSTRRRTGASLLIDDTAVHGSLGGGMVEQTAIASARRLLAAPPDGRMWRREIVSIAQGPVLGLSTRGAVHVLIEIYRAAEVAALHETIRVARAMASGPGVVLVRPARAAVAALAFCSASPGPHLPEPVPALLGRLARAPDEPIAVSDARPWEGTWIAERLESPLVAFHIHGTGEIALALARILEGTPFHPIVHDVADDPDTISPIGAGRLEPGAYHAVLTGSHDRDVDLCQRLLADGAAGYIGLIGSRTKRAGLVARLGQRGIPPALADRIACPIGLPEVRGKEPAVIAIAIAAQAIARLRSDRRD